MDKKGPQCKSAPVGGRRGSVKRDMSTTNKEINNWIHKGNKDNEIQRKAARNFSLLAENVTEERMLYARQLELGRERYKFLANHDYEKSKFLERQQNKQKRMKTFMSSARKVIGKAHSEKPRKTLTIRIPQVGEASPRGTPIDEVEVPTRARSNTSRATSRASMKRERRTQSGEIPPIHIHPPNPILKKSSSGQMTKADRKDTRKLGVLRSASPNKHQSKAPAKNQRSNSDQRGLYVNTSFTQRGNMGATNVTDNANKLPEVHAPYNGCMYHGVGMPQKLTSSNPTLSVRYKEKPAPIASIKRSTTFNGPVASSWLNSPTVRKYGERFDTSVCDPRYLALASSLGDSKYPNAKVKDIIASNEVLRSTSKSEGAANAKKMHAKFIALILENEFKQ